MSPSYHLSRALFARGLALVYFLAFASSFVQYPGLFSQVGVAPIPPAIKLAEGFRVPADETMLGLHVSAMVLSLCICLNVLFSPNLLFLLPLSYWWLISTARMTGAPFFNYQWDQLLVETGVIGSLWVVRLDQNDSVSISALWAIRFLAFKLMFSSGVVKITADDPTWLNLRALHYHFASQPLPTPLAWFAHKLPDWMLRVGTAGSLFIEIPLTLFILSPFPFPRVVVAVMTTLLMVNIALTGNYNFFNLLTVVLMIPLVNERDFRRGGLKQSHIALLINLVGTAILFGAAGWYTVQMFEFSNDAKHFPVKLRLTPAQLNSQMNRYLPWTVAWSVITVGGGMVFDIVQSWRLEEARNLHLHVGIGTLSLIFLGMSALPMLFSLMTDRAALSDMLALAPTVTQPLVQAYMAYGQEFTSSYGLFRVMTGVGRDAKVRVPTVVLKVGLANEDKFHSLKFRSYASEHGVPSIVQPHQPRLDWQMWFLSLAPGRVRQQRWFVSLCERLMEGEKAVFTLLPASEEKYIGKIARVRAELAEFDFTTSMKDVHWWRRVEGSPKDVVIFEAAIDPKKTIPVKQRTQLLDLWIEYGKLVPMTILVMLSSIRLFRILKV